MKPKIVFENNDLIVIDKPAGVLVHPTCPQHQQAGLRGGRAQKGEKDTLVDFIKSHVPGIDKLNWPDVTRPGIVHRLDKDTSGLIIMAKNPETLAKLQEQFQKRGVQKTYLALVLGNVQKEGKIEADITRGKAGLQKVMDTTYSFSQKTRPALTLYKPIKHFRYKNNDLTLLEVSPKTGRMHQIRVHLKHLGYPIIGDQLYNIKTSRNLAKELGLSRQFLHAAKLEFTNPVTGKILVFESELPKDLKNIMVKL